MRHQAGTEERDTLKFGRFESFFTSSLWIQIWSLPLKKMLSSSLDQRDPRSKEG
jgi:hypothetical protein